VRGCANPTLVAPWGGDGMNMALTELACCDTGFRDVNALRMNLQGIGHGAQGSEFRV